MDPDEDAFDQELKSFYRMKGIKHRIRAKVCKHPISLFKLFKRVKNWGGFDAVSSERLWTDLVLDFPGSDDANGNFAQRCKQLYRQRLLDYEKWKEETESIEQEKEGEVRVTKTAIDLKFIPYFDSKRF